MRILLMPEGARNAERRDGEAVDTQHLAVLRQAAIALISTAAAPTVLATLRTLLDDADLAVPDLPPPAPEPRPRTPPPSPAARKRSQPKPSAAWEALRQRVRQAMPEPAVTYRELAPVMGITVASLRHNIGRRKPPSAALQKRLADWLDEAPAVATALPFRARGNSRADNGADSSAPHA